jgi:plasmid stabilization system protein ParE
MAYRVELAKGAEAQLEELYLWVMERAPQQGEAWFKGLEQAILSLEHHAERCPVAPESFDPDRPVRVLHYGRRPHVYRVFFAVDDRAKLVRVLHVRRGARRRVAPDDIAGN